MCCPSHYITLNKCKDIPHYPKLIDRKAKLKATLKANTVEPAWVL